MTVRQTVKLAYFNLSLCCVLVVGLEISGQALYYLWQGHPLVDRSRHLLSKAAESPFEVHPFLAGRLRSNISLREGVKSLTTVENHTRWTGASGHADAIRVALIGGSTTFGSGVTDEETWAAHLQAMLGSDFEVTNFGVPGYSSAEAIIQLALIVPESRPDIVVLYQGWNDIHNYHDAELGPDYYAHGVRQYSNLGIQRPSPVRAVARAAEVSAIVRLASVLSRMVFISGSRLDAAHAENPAYPPPDRQGESTPDPLVDRLYIRNLRTLKALVRHQGAFALFVPQVLDYSRFRGTSGSWWTPHIQNSAMPRLLARLNLFMNDVCRPHEAGCTVLNEVSGGRWTPDDFIDEGHFSGKGNLAFARIMAPHLRAIAERITRGRGSDADRKGEPPRECGAPAGESRETAACRQDRPSPPAPRRQSAS